MRGKRESIPSPRLAPKTGARTWGTGLIVAQINQVGNIGNTDPYSGPVDYNNAPWVDWGPYLWASGVNISPGNQLNWCDSTTTSDSRCTGDPGDFRYGDLINSTYWGDHTHPTYKGQEKVATQLLKFIQGNLPTAQSYISNWVTPWVLTK